jgi:hypothetical protein
MNHTLIDILFISIIIVLYILAYFKQIRQNKSYTGLIEILSKNVDFLLEYHKKKEILELKNSIQLYTKFQIISKISKCDHICFFKYDYSSRVIILDYVLGISNNGNIIQYSSLDKMPITGFLFTLNILKLDNNKLYSFRTEELKNKNIHLHTAIASKELNKIYYKNVYKEDKPFGIILISYKDENFELENDDQTEILRIIDNMKYII